VRAAVDEVREEIREAIEEEIASSIASRQAASPDRADRLVPARSSRCC
jgi:hypothetical protein